MSFQNFVEGLYQNWVPKNLITEEVSGLFGNTVLAEMGKIIHYYDIYDNGTDFPAPNVEGYVPADLRYKKLRTLIDKEARFLFAKPPEYFIKAVESNEQNNMACSAYQMYLNNVLKENRISNRMVKAAKDCLIGGRIAIFINFNSEDGIKITFSPALEFVYEVDEYEQLTKIVGFFSLNDTNDAEEQRLYKKKYWMKDGKCHVSEGIYNGSGALVESKIDDLTTEFTYIPAYVITNSCLTGEIQGRSEMEGLIEYEEYYNRLSNLDIDSERQGMNPIRYTVDASPKSVSGLSVAAGAFWDLQSDPSAPNDSVSARVGTLENSMSYSATLNTTLERIKNTMYEQLDVPEVSSSDLKGIVTSGKTLKAIYWGLIVRCDEKMLDWRPALEFMAQCIIDGAKLYPDIAAKYIIQPLTDVEYIVSVENQYPLPEDETEEKAIDLSEIGAKTMSIKSYLKKWRNMNENDADAEIMQIAKEQQLLNNSFMPTGNEFETGEAT